MTPAWTRLRSCADLKCEMLADLHGVSGPSSHGGHEARFLYCELKIITLVEPKEICDICRPALTSDQSPVDTRLCAAILKQPHYRHHADILCINKPSLRTQSYHATDATVYLPYTDQIPMRSTRITTGQRRTRNGSVQLNCNSRTELSTVVFTRARKDPGRSLELLTSNPYLIKSYA